MKIKTLLVTSTISLLSAAAVNAENAVILEGFENNIDSATLGTWGGSRIPDGVAFSQYTKTDAEDINVTEGNKSLKVDLSLSEGWVNDFLVTLSDEASEKVHAAARATNDVARYILRYDIIFPGGTAWMNNQAFFGNVNDQLNNPNSANGGKATMSWAIDLTAGLPEEGPIVLRFADNFDASEDPFVGPMTLYVDNIRLVDTYAPGAKPVTTILQGFETASLPTGGAADLTPDNTRTTYSQYTKQGADDIKVTEGTKSLKVDYTGGGGWRADFTVPFANTMLADVLKLNLPAEERPTLAQLERYTLRFDIIYPDRDENGQPAWAVMSQYARDGSWYPYSQARRDSALGLAQTVSITLDQVPNWESSADGAPMMVFVAQGDFTDAYALYYDNFRLIDTGAVAAAKPQLDGIKMSAGKILITWTGGVLQSSTSLSTPQWSAVPGAVSGNPLNPPASGPIFYRVAGQ